MPPLRVCYELMISFIVPLFLRERLSFKSTSLGELEFFLLSSIALCFPPRVERVFLLIIFIAAISSSIVIEESPSGVSQPFRLLCGKILNLPFIINKHS